jgi:hypothetical protein
VTCTSTAANFTLSLDADCLVAGKGGHARNAVPDGGDFGSVPGDVGVPGDDR